MSATARPRPADPARAALKRWTPPRAPWAILAARLAATGGWVLIAFGLGGWVEALASGAAAGAWPWLAISGAFLRAAAGWASDALSARAGLATTGAARRELFDRFGTDPGFGGGVSDGVALAWLIDRPDRLAGHAARWVPGVRAAVSGPLIVLAAAATQSWLSAALLAVTVAALPVFLWLTATETAGRARAQQASLDALSGAFQARVAVAGTLRAFRAVDRETERLASASDRLARDTLGLLRVAFLSGAVLEFFASVSIALVAVYVGFSLLGEFPFDTGETLTLKEGLTVLILAPEFFAPIRALAGLHHDRADARAAAETLAGALQTATAPSEPDPPLSAPPRLSFDGVDVVWPDGSRGATGVRFEAAPGEITALVGPSGSGKTACLLVLLGRGRVAAGRVLVDGRAASPRPNLSRSVAWAAQRPWTAAASVAENLRLAAPEADDARLRAALDLAGLDLSLDARIGPGGRVLSGGEAQRLALARAALRDAPLLLLDEPTAHLDPEAEAAFLAALRRLAEGRTVLMATHSPAAIAAADRVVGLARP